MQTGDSVHAGTNGNATAASTPDGNDLLTVEQAARALQLSQSSIRAYIRQGSLKAFRVAGLRKVLIPREELMRLLEPARPPASAAQTFGGQHFAPKTAKPVKPTES